MKDTYLNKVLQAVGEKIDRLEGELYIINLERENLREEIKRLQEANNGLLRENEELRYHLNPLSHIKRKETDNA